MFRGEPVAYFSNHCIIWGNSAFQRLEPSPEEKSGDSATKFCRQRNHPPNCALKRLACGPASPKKKSGRPSGGSNGARLSRNDGTFPRERFHRPWQPCRDRSLVTSSLFSRSILLFHPTIATRAPAGRGDQQCR